MNRIPTAPTGTYINSPFGEITTLSNVNGLDACSLTSTVNCVFRVERGPATEESTLKDVECGRHKCMDVIWITRDMYALHRMTR